MSSNGEITLIEPRGEVSKVPAPKKSKRKKNISISAVERWMAEGSLKKLRPVRLRAQAKVGKFIEQEGEHHISKTMLAEGAERLEESLEMCETMWTEACDKNDLETKKEAMKWRLMILAEMNVTAKNLNATRHKADPGNDNDLPRVPTMPARTEIINNTQIVLHTDTKTLP